MHVHHFDIPYFNAMTVMSTHGLQSQVFLKNLASKTDGFQPASLNGKDVVFQMIKFHQHCNANNRTSVSGFSHNLARKTDGCQPASLNGKDNVFQIIKFHQHCKS